MAEIRLQKILADAGVASRRGSEELILAGRVSVDGKQITELGSKFDPEISIVEVDGEKIKSNKTKTYLAFYKPRGVLSTMTDPENRPNLGDFFSARNERLFHVGRLDKDSEGLILLTNDGDLTQKLTHPRYQIEKEYEITSNEPLTNSMPSHTRQRGTTRQNGRPFQKNTKKTTHNELSHPKINS